jgi:predicted dienelactone hydrolase
MASSVGARRARVSAPHLENPIDLIALYPSVGQEAPLPVGPYTIDVALGGVMAPGPWPVVVVSHGSGGSPFTHRGLARHLARAGFLVLLPTHPGNNRDDNHLADTADILVQRPRDVTAVLDWAASPDGFPGQADVRRVGMVGHSLGGYTGLALAHGRPHSIPGDMPGVPPRPIPVSADDRVAALVLLAPAAPWFIAEGSLDDVRVPILMLTGEHDRMTGGHGALIASRLRDGAPLEHRVVAGAGHFSFLAPFPPEMVDPAFPPSQDPPGFDRAAFHAALHPEVEAFFLKAIPVGGRTQATR